MDLDFVKQVQRSTEKSFSAGLYCAESVALALAKGQGIENELFPKVATAFSSDMSCTCGTCGALTGAIMGVGLALGREKIGESVQDSYEATQKLVRDFEKEFGARYYHDLHSWGLESRHDVVQFADHPFGFRS